LEIRNQKKFLIGLIIMILGTFIIVYDYPQIEYFNDLEKETFQILENDKREIYQKILIEFLIGIIFFGIGIMLILISIFKKFKNGFR
jgi:c-di-AMP phosphodiesterase-like protein